MRNFLKHNFPYIFKLAKYIYISSFVYKSSMDKMKKANDKRRSVRLVEDLKILKEVFNDEYFVHNGPFSGLKYIRTSSGSALLPKIMGSYEEPIQKWIEKVIEKKYKRIIDVGCAEGFYTAGFAMRMPETEIIAYDIDAIAIQNANELIKLNDLRNVELKTECTHAELNLLCDESTLVFCDIEGFESVLLDPLKAPNLKKVDLIIESHDFLVENVTEMLIKRFITSHVITIAVDYPIKREAYNIPTKISDELFTYIVQEYRQPVTKYILMEHF